MVENYVLIYKDGKLDYIPAECKLPVEGSAHTVSDALLEEGWLPFFHLGDPELMQCSVYRKRNTPGGIFIMHALDILFIAQANSNLVFGLACGHFANLVSDIRYGTDIWEEMEGSDD